MRDLERRLPKPDQVLSRRGSGSAKTALGWEKGPAAALACRPVREDTGPQGRARRPYGTCPATSKVQPASLRLRVQTACGSVRRSELTHLSPGASVPERSALVPAWRRPLCPRPPAPAAPAPRPQPRRLAGRMRGLRAPAPRDACRQESKSRSGKAAAPLPFEVPLSALPESAGDQGGNKHAHN